MSTTVTRLRTAERDSLDQFIYFSSVGQALASGRKMRLDRGWIIAKKKPDAKRAYLLSAAEFGNVVAAGATLVAVYGVPATFADPDTGEYPLAADHWKDLT